jgi:hypothetical protein
LLIDEEIQGQREFTDFTPEGRLISTPTTAAADPVHAAEEASNKAEQDARVEAYKRREAAEIAKLPAEAQARIAKQREKSAAVESAMVPALFYAARPDGTFEITGAYQLKHDNRDLLGPLYLSALDAIIATTQQLGHLIRQFELKKVPFKPLGDVRQPGE